MKLMYLKFLDHGSQSDESWKSFEDMIPEIPSIEVVGFLIKEDDNAYFLTQAHGDNEGRNIFVVIKSTVIKKKIFQVPK